MRPFDWAGLWRPIVPPWEVALRAIIVYAFVHSMLRLLGRRELGRYTTSDVLLLFLISIAMRKTIVTEDDSLTTGMVALGTLVLVDAVLARITQHSRVASRIIEGPIRLLVRDGEIDEDELRRAHLSHDELYAQLRGHGRESLEDVEKAFFERSGEVTFIFRR